MAITGTLVYAGHNRLRYLISSTNADTALTITCTGAASPDLITDSLAGPIKQIARVRAQGYGKIPATGALTTAQSRALWMSNGAVSLVGQAVPTAICRLEQRTAVKSFIVEADSAGFGDASTAVIVVTPLLGSAATAYLDIEIPGAIGA